MRTINSHEILHHLEQIGRELRETHQEVKAAEEKMRFLLSEQRKLITALREDRN